MEQHPIPRQITTFEFKLIGFMTLTQFIYLVVFIPLAYVVFKIFPIPFLNVLLAFMVALLGLALAFLPVNSRPLDVWIKNFYKRMISPTQYFYHKQNPSLNYLSNLYFDQDPHKVEAHIQAQEKLTQYLASKPAVAMHLTVPSFVAALDDKRAAIAQILQAPYDALMHHAPEKKEKEQKKRADRPADMRAAPDEEVDSAQRQMQDVAERLKERSELESLNATPLKEELKPLKKDPSHSLRAFTEAKSTEDKEKVIAPPPKKPFLAGVVKNIKNIPLPGILIYVKDDTGTSLRLLKSNPYGVFATYNALTPATYVFEPKDPKGIFNFATIKVDVQDVNDEPLELVSKELI